MKKTKSSGTFNSIIFIKAFKFILVFVICLILIFGIIIDRIMLTNTEQKSIFYTESLMNQISKTVISDKTTTEMLAGDEQLKMLLRRFADESSLGRLKLSRELTDLLDGYRISSNEISDLSIYTTMPCDFGYQSLNSLAEKTESAWYDCFKTDGIVLYNNSDFPSEKRTQATDAPNREQLTVICPISIEQSDYRWFICTNISKDYLYNMYLQSQDDGCEYYILDNHGEIVLCRQLNKIGTKLDSGTVSKMVYSKKSAAEFARYSDRNNLIACSTTNEYGWKLVSFEPKSEAVDWRGALIGWMVLVVLLFALVCYKFSNIFAKLIAAPLSRLSKAMYTGSPVGNTEFFSNEISKLYDCYNDMIAHSEEMMNEIRDQQDKVADAEMRALISQINPHFLYNTLNVISWKAMDANCPDICKILSKLGKLYRLNYKFKSTYCTLNDELTSILLYMDLQKDCFNNSFDYTLDITEDAEKLIVPKFILQPIIENSIIHGFSQKLSNGLITISVRTDKALSIIIRDNGVGIENDTLEKLNSGNYFSEKYGLRNINERIKLSCGEEYGLAFSSHSMTGTAVTVTLPINYGEDNQNV